MFPTVPLEMSPTEYRLLALEDQIKDLSAFLANSNISTWTD